VIATIAPADFERHRSVDRRSHDRVAIDDPIDEAGSDDTLDGCDASRQAVFRCSTARSRFAAEGR
jgi:hypothetical protein